MPEDAPHDYILWLGGIFDHATMLRRPGVNPAGRRAQRDIVHALEDNGVRVRTLGHVPEPLWPRGRLRETGTDPLEPGIDGETVAYWNLPALRMRSLSRSYLRGYRETVRRYGRPSLVFSYNAYPYNVAVGRQAQAQGVPWVPLVADVPTSEAERRRHERTFNEAAGRVFLSWFEYQKPGSQEPKYHLDFGVEELRIPDTDRGLEEPPVVVYTGALGPHGGASYLVKSFQKVQREDLQLWICGFGSNPDVDRAVAEDDRIRFLGLLPEEELHEVCERATVFVNPRPSALPENASNFPSKLLHYLRYGKPVISTWTSGIAPAYREVLTVLDEETPESLARTIDEVADWDEPRRRENTETVRQFLEARRWPTLTRDLIDWLESEVQGRDLAAR